MIKSLEIYLDGIWNDYTNNLEANSIVRQDRCDDAFAIGSLQIRCERDRNIPPYTPLRINGNEYWFCSSKCKKYLTIEGYYIHNIELLELTSILSCYILGSKSFSTTGTNTEDFEKLNIIKELMEQKYNVKFIYEDTIPLIFYKEQEFVFGPGTTMYDALLEIIKSYDGIKVKINELSVPTNYDNKFTYYISFQFDNSEFILNDNLIIDEYSSQKVDDYGAVLESEMTNVIDRTNSTYLSYLSLRSDDVRMIEDNSCLILPTKIESVKSFKVRFNAEVEIMLTFEENTEENISLPSLGTIKTLKEWIEIFSSSPEYLDRINFFKEKIIDLGIPEFEADSYKLTYSRINDKSPIKLYNKNETHILLTPIDISNYILPIDKWNLIEEKLKPKYVYYTSGTNKIEGMNSYYKFDLWDLILQQTAKPFLDNEDIYGDNLIEEKIYYKNNYTDSSYMDISIYKRNDKATMTHCFDVEYYPITDPFVWSEKSVVPFNESSVKKFAKTYDKSGNYIDFDRMIDSLELTNNIMGMPELSIECVIDDKRPKAYQYINRFGKKWIISSVITTSTLTQTTALINLVSGYNKVADAIGVKTQYNATKNPLNNITTRPVYFFKQSNIVIPDDVYCQIHVWGEGVNKWLYKRAAVMRNANITYIYFEALDQYSFDTQAEHVNFSNYICRDVSYCNGYNELKNISISIGRIPSLSREDSLALPIYDGEFESIIDLESQIVYKDAREKLSFTIQIKAE